MKQQFLWGGITRPSPEFFVSRSTRWWRQYSLSLRLSKEAAAELHRTSTGIASLLPDPVAWGGAPSPFRGLVVGAVQSGKTSSMIGVSAVALDQGYRFIVVLAGGKDDLRQQTARRFNVQLLRQRDEIPGPTESFTISPNVVERPLGGIALPYSVDIHQWAPGFLRIRETLRTGGPCVFVIKKNPASLSAMRGFLQRAYSEFGGEELPTLILDDECDDASVDRAGMPIPEAISNLWRTKTTVRTAYVGYTATAAANLLQAPENDLYPEHFAYLLRHPAQGDSALTVRIPNPDEWYSGSQCFYEDFGQNPGEAENFLVNSSVNASDSDGPQEHNESLREALLAYIVAGAYRLVLQPGARFDDGANFPAPHSMLVQTSAFMDDHERVLGGLASMFGGKIDENGVASFDESLVSADVAANEGCWRGWYENYHAARERLYLERPSLRFAAFASWDMVRARIEEVARHIRVKAINSDPILGQQLDYSPSVAADGSIRPPNDVFVIVVGGSRLSRGLTIEGLCTTYFTRWAPNPTEDTVLQISRWFGYRGPHLEFCRLFTPLAVYQALEEIHENDRDLRFQLAQLMDEQRTPRQAGLILNCNPRALPTAKLGIGKIYDLNFSPYQTVFKFVEIGEFSRKNENLALRVIAELRDHGAKTVTTTAGHSRGELSRGWLAVDVANILDSLSYSFHNPSLAGNPASEFHRSPDLSRALCSTIPFRADPYQVAAYLREWAALFEAGKTSRPPLFDVGVAYGNFAKNVAPFDLPLLDRTIAPNGKLVGDWTGRSSGWKGDAFFDGPESRQLMAGSSLRGAGLRGLLLLYVVHKDAVGKQGGGLVRDVHSVTFGISIPGGGPMLRRVTVSPT